MIGAEGTVKFNLDFREVDLEDSTALASLLQWRDVFYRLGAIGLNPERYDGYAFGNISHRLDNSDAFLVSGTQTGCYETATREQFTCVDHCDTRSNTVVAHGPTRPSSESLTHGAIYALDPGIKCILHGHLPTLWSHAGALNIPCTPADVEYGTPQMADAIARLFEEQGRPASGIFCMAGHEDGVVLFAKDFPAIEALLTKYQLLAEP